MIIGLAGTFAAGKDTIAQFLKQKGFAIFSLSDILRNELRTKKAPVTRENQITLGNTIREKFGPAEVAKRAIEKARASGESDWVFVSLLNPAEIIFLKQQGNFSLWFVDAPADLRYSRSQVRGLPDDFTSEKDFKDKELAFNSANASHQQIAAVAALADVEIINDKDLLHLHKTIDQLLEEQKFNLNHEFDAG